MDFKKRIIIIIVCLLLLVVLLLLFVIYKGNKTGDVEEVPVDLYNSYFDERERQGITENDAVAQEEDNANEYFTVEAIIKSFNTNVNYLGSSAKDLNLFVTKDNEQRILKEYKERGYKYINNVLASSYKTTYSVNNDYIYNAVKNNIGKKYTITDMYAVDDSAYINTYFVYGNYEGNEFNFVVVLDRYNYTYEIYLNNFLKDREISKNNLNSMKTLNIKHVESNENNTFQYKNIEEGQLVKMYYEEYMDLIKNDVNKAYSLVNEEYKQKRKLSSIDDFKACISDRAEDYSYRGLETYSVTKCDGYTEIVCTDVSGSRTIFRLKGISNYSTILDSYTISIKAIDEEYNNADSTKKAALCLNTFIECLNNKDYEAAYNYLNKSFRENNFKNVEEFKKYANNLWFNINEYMYDSAKVQNGDYIFSGEMSNKEFFEGTDSQSISQSFVVKSGTTVRNFELSFEVYDK